MVALRLKDGRLPFWIIVPTRGEVIDEAATQRYLDSLQRLALEGGFTSEQAVKMELKPAEKEKGASSSGGGADGGSASDRPNPMKERIGDSAFSKRIAAMIFGSAANPEEAVYATDPDDLDITKSFWGACLSNVQVLASRKLLGSIQDVVNKACEVRLKYLQKINVCPRQSEQVAIDSDSSDDEDDPMASVDHPIVRAAREARPELVEDPHIPKFLGDRSGPASDVIDMEAAMSDSSADEEEDEQAMVNVIRAALDVANNNVLDRSRQMENMFPAGSRRIRVVKHSKLKDYVGRNPHSNVNVRYKSMKHVIPRKVSNTQTLEDIPDLQGGGARRQLLDLTKVIASREPYERARKYRDRAQSRIDKRDDDTPGPSSAHDSTSADVSMETRGDSAASGSAPGGLSPVFLDPWRTWTRQNSGLSNDDPRPLKHKVVDYRGNRVPRHLSIAADLMWKEYPDKHHDAGFIERNGMKRIVALAKIYGLFHQRVRNSSKKHKNELPPVFITIPHSGVRGSRAPKIGGVTSINPGFTKLVCPHRDWIDVSDEWAMELMVMVADPDDMLFGESSSFVKEKRLLYQEAAKGGLWYGKCMQEVGDRDNSRRMGHLVGVMLGNQMMTNGRDFQRWPPYKDGCVAPADSKLRRGIHEELHNLRNHVPS